MLLVIFFYVPLTFILFYKNRSEEDLLGVCAVAGEVGHFYLTFQHISVQSLLLGSIHP